MANEKKYLDFAALGYYDEKLKAWVAAADEVVLADAKEYADGLADNYDPAGTAQTKFEELANGQVKDNMDAIAKLNGDASTEGSVAKAVADSAATLNDSIADVDEKADAAQAAADKAQGEVDAVELDMGDVDNLSTENKTIVGAINEVLTAVGAGGTAAAITMTTDTTTDGALKSYTIKQGTTTVGVIDIPKDMVVEAGSVVTLADGDIEGYAAGTYIKLVLANVAEPLYINVGTLVDIYKAKEGAAQVQITIDSATREISADIVAGSVTSTELADNAVVTAKIADANVTKAKLSTAVQASLDKADAAAEDATNKANAAETNAKGYADGLNTAMDERVQALEAIDHEHENKEVLDGITAEKVAAWDAAEANAADAAKEYADGLNTAMDERVQALEAIDHDHANKAELDKIVEGDKAKWDAAEQNAKDYADGLNTAMNTRVEALEGASATHALKSDVEAVAGRVTTAEGEIDTLQSEMDAVEAKVADNEAAIAAFTPITEAEIDELFA